MLKIVEGDSLKVRINEIKNITVCSKKASKYAILQIVELKSGDVVVFQISNNIEMESFGYMYIKNNNVKIKTRIEPKDEVQRIVICRSKLMRKRIIEIIEFSDGKVKVIPLSKSIVTEKVDSEYIRSGGNKA